MPGKHHKQTIKLGILPKPYDPNSETEPSIRTAALYWELLRRNTRFKELAINWIADNKFRVKHSESNDYHHSTLHFPRCALDWMISGAARVRLADVQLAAGHWYRDNRFNFGPIVATQRRHPLDVDWKTIPSAFNIQPLADAPPPLRIEQTWPETPLRFREQFNLAVHDGGEFQVVTNHIHEAGNYLQWVAARLYRKDAPEKLPQIVQQLFELGQYFHELAAFQGIFAVPNAYCPPGKFKAYLDAIRKHCSEAGQIVRRYSAQASWLGTAKAWRWFLVAEQRDWDPKNLKQMYQLARLYSQELRKQKYTPELRKNVKVEGYRTDPEKSTSIGNRRKTVADFINQIREWRDSIYPTDRWLAFTRPIVRKPPDKISSAS